jgi:flagellar hook assembly protein FlgD
VQSAGDHRVIWDGKDERGKIIPSGIYYYQLRAGKAVLMGQMTMVK